MPIMPKKTNLYKFIFFLKNLKRNVVLLVVLVDALVVAVCFWWQNKSNFPKTSIIHKFVGLSLEAQLLGD
jgi:hypothetical protein